ncbi:MAG: ABC transporter substrate-binding protein [Clostridia bacterium]|nr:ABC transporter substrate-binding protein [Clostridia bacterium]
MKKVLALILAVMMVLSLAACGTATKTEEGKDTFTIGICQLVQHEALDAATKGFMDALKAEFGDKVTFLNENASGDVQTCTTIVNNFVNKKVDLILANATPALQAAANGTTTIPVLGTSITEYGTALGIKDFSGIVGGNVSGTSDLAPLDEQAAMITELFPEAKKVSILFCTSEANSDYQVKVIQKNLEEKGLTVEKCGFTDSNDVTTAATKAANADVIYIPTDNTAASCAATINGMIGDTPVIAGEEGICKNCGVATLSISYSDLGKTTGKMAAKILKGEAKIEEMKIEYAPAVKKFNKEKCEQLKIGVAALEEKGYVAIAK